MLRYRLIYAIVLSAALAFFIVYRPWFSWFFLVLILLMMPLDLFASLPGMFTRTIKFAAPLFLEEGAKGHLTISVIKRSKISFPLKCLYVKTRVTGDDFVLRCNIQCPAGTVNRGEVRIDTSRTGLTVFEVRKLYCVSVLGLFAVRTNSNEKISVLILPAPKKPTDDIELPRGLILRPKPGGGFSEEHDMRGYLPGDPVRSIHWKLSAKYDSLIIREPLVPPQQNRLVHIVPWENQAQRDSALANLRWVSDYLTSRGLTYYIKFGDRQLVSEITGNSDLVTFLRKVLDNSIVHKPVHHPRITRFSWVYKVVGTSDIQEEIRDDE